MSGGLAPSKSTVYVGNLPYSLTNNDLHKIFEKYGRVVKVTIVKDKDTHKSKGVAFVLYLERDSASKCVQSLNNTQMFGRTIKASIAKDNGRATEFIRRKVYKDKTRCYECGEEGHLSYCCPKNKLGDREPPPKKEKKKRKGDKIEGNQDYDALDSDSDHGGEDIQQDSLSAAIMYQYEKVVADCGGEFSAEAKRKKYQKDSYFSDEEALDD
jgi:U11/U12 small nuclear ribonucleoprotein SNRNP31